MLTSLSVWMVRNQSLMEMWWLFSSLARYPKEIFAGPLGRAAGRFLHVHPADPAGRQRPGQRDGPRARPGDGRLHDRRDRRPALAQPPVLPARAAVVPQRQQLKRAVASCVRNPPCYQLAIPRPFGKILYMPSEPGSVPIFPSSRTPARLASPPGLAAFKIS